MADVEVQEQVRARYAAAATAVTATGRDALAVVDADQSCAPTTVEANASCCGGGGAVDAAFGSALYSAGEQGELPAEAVAASLGCGNPLVVAELRAGERVLDLGSGGGIDVLLSARRVGDTGFAYANLNGEPIPTSEGLSLVQHTETTDVHPGPRIQDHERGHPSGSSTWRWTNRRVTSTRARKDSTRRRPTYTSGRTPAT